MTIKRVVAFAIYGKDEAGEEMGSVPFSTDDIERAFDLKEFEYLVNPEDTGTFDVPVNGADPARCYQPVDHAVKYVVPRLIRELEALEKGISVTLTITGERFVCRLKVNHGEKYLKNTPAPSQGKLTWNVFGRIENYNFGITIRKNIGKMRK